MNNLDFKQQHKEIVTKYNVCFEPDCDAWFFVKGMLYYDNDTEKFITHITGIEYDEDGVLYGDFEGYLLLLDKDLSEYRMNAH